MEKFIRKSIGSLIQEKYSFFIPAFQRGYKWTPSEVQKLMSDIWEFYLSPKSKNEDAFYCLQPVVVKLVKKGDNCIQYHVIDGQQRLTTMLILQQAINDYKAFSIIQTELTDEAVRQKLSECTLGNRTYSIDYETRGASSVWLKLRMTPEKMENNSDFYHILNAYRTALEFIDSIDASGDSELVKWIVHQCQDNRLLTKQNTSSDWKKYEACHLFSQCMHEKCDVIWYELEESNESDEDVFDRLNTGKISLNNAELIKALFLQKDNFPVIEGGEAQSNDYRTNIAREWDSIEHQLQNPGFWYFIYDEKSVGMRYDTRIEFILDLLSGKTKKQSDKYYFTFDHYDALFKEYRQSIGALGFVENEWKRIRELMQTLQDWYDNKTYYHYIGYLISQGHSVNEIVGIQFPHGDDGKSLPVPSKTEFIRQLEDLIRDQIRSYRSKDLFKSEKGLTPVLLLFNVLTELSSPDEHARYPFHHHKTTSWNEEHVAPATPFDPNDAKRCFSFAAEMLEYYTDLSYFAELDDLHKKELLKPKEEQRKPAELRDEAYENAKKKYEEFIPSLRDEKEICERLLEIFKARGKDVIEQSRKCHDDICKEFDTSSNQLSTDNKERDFIWNQVLLDEGTNKSYGNAIFPYKRKRIIKNSSMDIFVPIGTRNVFFKAYSYHMQNMFEWDKTDASRYLSAIIRMLNSDGRNFFDTEALLKEGGLPDFVDSDIIKMHLGYVTE